MVLYSGAEKIQLYPADAYVLAPYWQILLFHYHTYDTARHTTLLELMLRRIQDKFIIYPKIVSDALCIIHKTPTQPMAGNKVEIYNLSCTT